MDLPFGLKKGPAPSSLEEWIKFEIDRFREDRLPVRTVCLRIGRDTDLSRLFSAYHPIVIDAEAMSYEDVFGYHFAAHQEYEPAWFQDVKQREQKDRIIVLDNFDALPTSPVYPEGFDPAYLPDHKYCEIQPSQYLFHQFWRMESEEDYLQASFKQFRMMVHALKFLVLREPERNRLDPMIASRSAVLNESK